MEGAVGGVNEQVNEAVPKLISDAHRLIRK